MIRPLLLILSCFLLVNLQAQYKADSLKIKDGYLHFYTKGEGQPLVLLQAGPGFSSYYMRSIADSLQGYKCVLIDYEGTGKSQYRKADTSWVSYEKVIDDIEQVRKKLNIEKWTILGHSYGTHFGLYYAIKNPLRVQKIILVSSIGTNNLFQRYANDNVMVRLSAEDMTQMGTIEADTSLDLIEKDFKMQNIMLKAYFYDKKKVAPFLNSVPPFEKTSFFNNDYFNAYFDNPHFWTWDISQQAYQLLNPIRIIQGRQDFVTDGQQEIMNMRLKDSKIFYIERSGHFPWLEKPSHFFNLLRNELPK